MKLIKKKLNLRKLNCYVSWVGRNFSNPCLTGQGEREGKRVRGREGG